MKTLFLEVAGLMVLATHTAHAGTKKQLPAEKPNIVILYADDLGYGDIGVNGARGVQTPNIDRLAGHGVNFTDVHSTAATCTPSRYSLLTGSYPLGKAAVASGESPLLITPGQGTLASMLKRAGYATAVVGKWHLGLGSGKPDWNKEITPGPREIGFDYSFLIPVTGDRVPCVYLENQRVAGADPADPIRVDYKNRLEGYPSGLEHPELLRVLADPYHSKTIVNGVSRIGYMSGGKKSLWKDEEFPYVLTKKAEAFITQHRDQPFFLYLAFHDIHVPRVPDGRFAGKSAMGPRGDAIVQLDWCVGELIGHLEKLGLAENTLVLFSSDNGPVLNDGYEDQAVERLGDHRPAGPFRGAKYSVFEAGTRMPTVIYWPGTVKPGTSSALLSQVDLYASLAALAGQKVLPGEAPDSENYLDAWLGRSNRGRSFLLERANTLALRMDNWKYIAPKSGGTPAWMTEKGVESGLSEQVQLYNLNEDVKETRNLTAEYPEIVKKMKDTLEKTVHPANAQRSIDEVTSGINRVLLEKNEQDIRDWLDARIRESGDFGVYSWGGESVKINGDVATVKLIRGAIADAAAQFFRAYEMLGDKKYLEAGLKTTDFFLLVQQPAGHFPRGATINRNGSVNVTGNGQIARIQDGYQFRPFALLLYSYKLTGDKKYLAGAKKLADLITRRVQNPDWGWCPDEFDTRVEGDVTMQKGSSGVYGVRGGGSYNDFATTDGCRISIMMYRVTGNKEYLKNTAKIGKWIFATQLGKGEVRGWADAYNMNNEPVVQRHFEGATIDPRNFDRFIGPLTIWLYLITDQEKYANLFRESYLWLKDREHPDGWAAEYNYEGQEVWTQDYVTYRYDQPETWPKSIKTVEVGDGKPRYSRDKVQLDDSKVIYELLQKGGREALLKWCMHSSVKYTPEQYMIERIAAAKRCTDQEMKVIVRCTGCGKAVKSNFLQRVQLRLAKPDACVCLRNSLDHPGRHGLEFQSWHGPHTWTQPYRPPYGWASWQYVWDGRLALGLIDPDTAAAGGRGMENMHYWPAWDVMGDWTTRCVEVENWFDIPLAGFID